MERGSFPVIWGWEPKTFASKVHEQSLKTYSRDLILKLKTEAMQQPGFRKTIASWYVYRLMLEGETELPKGRAV